jgi:hypothetical protein
LRLLTTNLLFQIQNQTSKNLSAKTKSIALSSRFGPSHEENIEYFANTLKQASIKQDQNIKIAEKFLQTCQTFMEASEPDEVNF